jgi:hypothetical protein
VRTFINIISVIQNIVRPQGRRIHMNFKSILALFGVMLFGAGIVMAISGMDATQSGSQYRWTGQTAGNVTTEGGNITNVNINGSTLTDRWASFWGNVAGAIVLGNQSTYVYQWAWTPTGGGEVCISEAPAFNFVGVIAAVPSDIDTAWVFPSGSDQAVDTFNSTCSALNFTHATVAAPAKIDHMGSSTFKTCAISVASPTPAEADYAFCAPIQTSAAGKNYNNVAANYEIMVPTTDGTASPSATEVYYFYAELN